MREAIFCSRVSFHGLESKYVNGWRSGCSLQRALEPRGVLIAVQYRGRKYPKRYY
jgi:hypothetical protein